MTDWRTQLETVVQDAMSEWWGNGFVAARGSLAAAVIDALGIGQVGWWNDVSLAHGGAAPHHGCGPGADVPVFSFGVLSGLAGHDA